PLPRHILGSASRQDADGFLSQPYWTREYVGAGPYRLERWEPGSFLEATAFDQHVLGRPKIGRVRLVIISDFNTVLSNVLAGEAHMPVDDSLRFQQGLVLQRDWPAGTVEYRPTLWRFTQFQHRPEYAS